MARTLNKAATEEQLEKVVEKLVETATAEKVDPNVRVKAAGLFLNTMYEFEYQEPAPAPAVDG